MSDTEPHVDVIVSVVEYETLMFHAVRDSLRLGRDQIPITTLLTARAAILGCAVRKQIASLIIEAHLPDADDRAVWRVALKALEAAGKPDADV